MTQIFIANDGTQFDTEKECLEYEATQDKVVQSCILLDKSFKKIDMMSPFYVEDVQYLWITDDELVEDIRIYLNEQYGLGGGIKGHGMYIMREDEAVWDSVDELITYHENKLTQLKNAKLRIIEKYNK